MSCLLEMKGMMIEFETVGRVLYITLLDEKAAKTVEFSSQTIIDLTKSGELIGVEMLSPNRSDLQRIAKKYHHPELSRINPDKLFKAVA